MPPARTERKEITTAHGEVQFETVECDSCGNEVVVDDAYDFIIGNVDRCRSWELRNNYEYEMGISHTRGKVCKYCRDDPVKFPPPTVEGGEEGFIIRKSTFVMLLSALFMESAILTVVAAITL